MRVVGWPLCSTLFAITAVCSAACGGNAVPDERGESGIREPARYSISSQQLRPSFENAGSDDVSDASSNDSAIDEGSPADDVLGETGPDAPPPDAAPSTSDVVLVNDSGSSPPPDITSVDSGTQPPDASSIDASIPVTDSGPVPTDTGLPDIGTAVDTGMAIDSGVDTSVAIDTGLAITDTGSSPPDMGSSSTDASEAAADTGTVTSDSGIMSVAIPPFDSATDAHVRSLVALGLAAGNRREVVAKIGDSITESGSFLYDCGFGWFNLGTHTELADTISYFRMVTLGSGRNSLNRASLCAVGGWTCADALAGAPSCALTAELDAIHPMWAIVMYGTNDMQRGDLATYQANMTTLLDMIEARSVVAVLSTIPPRSDTEPYISDVPIFNDVVRTLASTRHLPLIDYYAAMVPLPSQGISPDGIHPNTYLDPVSGTPAACFFTNTALQYGYNQRSFTALQMLTVLRGY